MSMRGAGSTTTQETLQKVEKVVRDAVEERFGSDFVFDPIVVEPRSDMDDDEYLHVYVVYKGDRNKLDSSWTLGLASIILDHTTDDEVWHIPSKSFVPKREWEQVPAKGRRESARPQSGRASSHIWRC